MSVQQLPALSQMMERQQSSGKTDQLQGWREWYSAIASLESLLKPIAQGLILSSPAPVTNPNQSLTTVVFTPEITLAGVSSSRLLTFAPVRGEETAHHSSPIQAIPLSADDPLQDEQFCLVFTSEFSLLLMLTVDSEGNSHFDFSFDPEVTQRAWLRLRSRLQRNSPEHLTSIEEKREQFPLCPPHYRLVSDFTRQLLTHLPAEKPVSEHHNLDQAQTPDVELLQALTHEVRTPLTTIRMLTRLLLKRKDLGSDVLKRLRVIDQECTEQINRMELIFQATELEGKTKQGVQLTPIPLEDLFAKSIPYWKKQAKRRNVELDVILPKQLPTVISSPELLTQVLTGLMENFTSRLPSGGKMKIQVTTAGSQIKLQLLSQTSNAQSIGQNRVQSPGKSIGQLLTLQPETGSLSLNLSVTKNLFEALGGKLTVRQRAEMGEVLTVFLPASIINQ
ncbi:histidine kinase [Halothece sp. PCC 7418]|uniref:sensor histidine kinase n=1 Tax=Halothece sp. (strain PCC 7418) TaxID=65093 RepID=UPI0002A070E8|nr:HAMP domain-containing sensor histidine kinase [Halothece sp. PCC 7418]AFZ45620.1 histidine kinase [Halothece sp. PCC 7418]